MTFKNQLPPDNHLSVKDYLSAINRELKGHKARVIGEVTEVNMYEGRSYLFFKLKDPDPVNPAILNCFMWQRDFDLCGMKLEEGLEIIVSGYPEIYVPYGRFSFKTDTVEPVGAGALKKPMKNLKVD